jgi:hypothetical protein
MKMIKLIWEEVPTNNKNRMWVSVCYNNINLLEFLKMDISLYIPLYPRYHKEVLQHKNIILQ